MGAGPWLVSSRKMHSSTIPASNFFGSAGLFDRRPLAVSCARCSAVAQCFWQNSATAMANSCC